MVAKVKEMFTTVTTEGALLPPDILQRIMQNDPDIGGMHPEAYHLYGERLNEATNRAWNRLQGAWQAFKQAQDELPDDDIGTTLTRERWLLVLFSTLDYGRLETATAVTLDGKSYAISHRYQQLPIHLLSYRVGLDERTKGVAGAATGSPHSIMQVFLNRTDEHLWGILSNGHKLRLLRDNASLTRQAYIEFDLQAMMDGELYSDFVLLYLLCHQSRVEGEKPADYWLETWRSVAVEQGRRALDDLRNGVEQAILKLGAGFISHPHNIALRDALKGENGKLDKQDYYRELLRLVYRLLFLFVAEDRDLLHAPDATDAQRGIYRHYSTRKLRDVAANLTGTRHHDLYEALRLVMRLLGGERDGGQALGLPVLGSMLFSDAAMTHIIDAKLANRDLLEAVRAISTIHDRDVQRLRSVDFKNLGSEELGSVYESLLELHPVVNVDARTFSLATAGGNERKTTGSYYTPTSLINALLDSALDPVIADAVAEGGTRAAIEARLLDLKICDPACGSGHFLIAAANRLAKRLAQVRTGEDEPTPDVVTTAKREVIANCVYGVDLNGMAVELCKVNLWLESLDPGKPLTFLDSRIRQGNSLLGTTPALMAGGIPEDAFPTKSGLIEGDEYKYVKALRKRNRDERKEREAGVRQLGLFGGALPADYGHLASASVALAAMPDDDMDALRAKEARFKALANDPEYVKGKFLADLWCAVFVWHKRTDATFADGTPVPPPPTDRDYRRVSENPLADEHAPLRRYTAELADRYDFLHWHTTYPEVFRVPEDVEPDAVTGWQGGFDAVLGNPPWEHTELKEKEFFAERAPEIANASGAKRKKMIKKLPETDPQLWDEYAEAKREADGYSHMVRNDGMYPLTGLGRINTYQLFAELVRFVTGPSGRTGIIIPSGIATDDTTKYFFNDLMQTHSLSSLYDFENRQGLFPAVDSRMKFSLVTMTGADVAAQEAEFAFFLHRVADLKDDWRRFALSAEDIARLNPNTGTMATFRSQRDAETTKAIYRRVPVLIEEATEGEGGNPWGVSFKQGLFNMTSDSDKFRTQDELAAAGYRLQGNHFVKSGAPDAHYLPLYEAKMMHQFTHRWATYEADGSTRDMTLDELRDPSALPLPRYWVDIKHVKAQTSDSWLLAHRKTARSTDERTMIVSPLPISAVGDKAPLFFVNEPSKALLLTGVLNSLACDYAMRQKLGATDISQFYAKQLPVIPPHTYTQALPDFIVPRVLELTYTAWDLQAFAQDVGYDGPPFVWDDERRFWLRCELDALYFHLYGVSRADADYIMETFPIVKRKDIKRTADADGNGGEYVTKQTILALYDQMADLPRVAVPAPKGEGTVDVPDVGQWETALQPGPASEQVAHPE